MRHVLASLMLALTLLGTGVATSSPAAAAVLLEPPLTFTGATSTVSRGLSTGQTTFGIRNYRDPVHGKVVTSTFYFEVSAMRCGGSGCRQETYVALSPQIDRLVARRVSVSADLRTATLAPTRLPITHTTIRYPFEGDMQITTKTVWMTVRASATAVGPSTFQTVRDRGPDYVVVIKGNHRPSTTSVTLGDMTWRTGSAPSEISSTTSRVWSLST